MLIRVGHLSLFVGLGVTLATLAAAVGTAAYASPGAAADAGAPVLPSVGSVAPVTQTVEGAAAPASKTITSATAPVTKTVESVAAPRR